jgi:hypothetical protein
MRQKLQDTLSFAGVYGSWLLIAAIAILVAFQIHSTMVFIGLRLVEVPAVNRVGWNTATIHGLSRFLYLALGIIWLGLVTSLERSLRKSKEKNKLLRHVLIILAIIGVVYIASYLILLYL